MSKFLDMMLKPEVVDVQKNLPRAKYEIKGLSRTVERLSGYRQNTIREVKN